VLEGVIFSANQVSKVADFMN